LENSFFLPLYYRHQKVTNVHYFLLLLHSDRDLAHFFTKLKKYIYGFVIPSNVNYNSKKVKNTFSIHSIIRLFLSLNFFQVENIFYRIW
jgi:hypothetical protein